MHKAIHYGPKLLCLFPLALLWSVYTTYLVARFRLGRWPTPMIDDPKSLSLPVPIYHAETMLMMMYGIPIFGALLVVFVLICAIERPEGWIRALVELAIAAFMLFATITILREEPFEVIMAWLFD